MTGTKEFFQNLVADGVVSQEPVNYDAATLKMYIAHLEAENAELKSSLTHANEECLKWHERAQNLLKDSGGSISGYEKKISDLQAENAALRERLEKAATFALDMCSEDDCAGDGSVGLPPCDMWHAWDTDGNGVSIESGCYLKEYLTELKGE